MSIRKPLTSPGAVPSPGPGMPLLRLGFRPFYLGGACFGLVAIVLWLAALHGEPLAGRTPAMSGVIWHAHEMIFGFIGAIVVGFLLTAVRAWTSVDTPHGAALAGLWLLWAAGRVLVWSGPEPVAAVVDWLFFPIVAVILLRVLIGAGNRHNVFLPGALLLLALLNGLFHWWAWHERADLSLRVADAAAGLMVAFVVVIAGRVLPMFTMNAIPGFQVKRWKAIERLAMPVTLLACLLDAVAANPLLIVPVAALAAVVHLVRLAGWRSWRVGARPLLWILHVAYAWIAAGFVLLALAAAGVIAHSLALHALLVGAAGCAIIGMMTRTSLGHTGRLLKAGHAETVAYGLMIAAALLRVAGPWLVSGMTLYWLDLAALCWCVSLLVFLVSYGPKLTAPRIDGKPG